MLPSLGTPSSSKLRVNRPSQVPDEGPGELDELGARGGVDSGIDLHDARSGLSVDRDEEPSAADVERHRAYADWLASLEPRQQRGGERYRLVGLASHEVDAGAGERAA
jgi:hypothetical protein